MNPSVVYIEITDLCNLSCPMCITDDHRLGKNLRKLNREEIQEKILRPSQDLDIGTVVIGGGEPTLSPNLLGVIDDALELNYDIYLATNLLKVNFTVFREILSKLKKEKDTIQISFDSVKPEEMNTIRGRNVYPLVLNNCKKILAIRDEIGSTTTIAANIVMQEDNLDSIIATVFFLLNHLTFDRVYVQLRHDYSEVTAENYNNQEFPKYDDETLEKLSSVTKDLFRLAEADSRIRPTLGSAEDWLQFIDDPSKITKKCTSSRLIYLDAYGNFRGCLHGTVLGNIYETSMSQYLHSKEYDDYIKLLDVCSICVHSTS